MERIVLICPNGVIEPEMLNHVLPFNYQKIYIQKESPELPLQTEPKSEPTEQRQEPTPQKGIITNKSLHEMEKESITQALIDNRGIQTKAATQLGMTARQIGYKIKKYNINL
jgi:Nif-specific regulatory protein